MALKPKYLRYCVPVIRFLLSFFSEVNLPKQFEITIAHLFAVLLVVIR